MNNTKHLSFGSNGKIANQKYEIERHMKIMTRGIDNASPTLETAGWRDSKEKRQHKNYDGKAILKEKEKQKNNNILAENLYNIKKEDRRGTKEYHPGWRIGKNGVVIDCYPKKDRDFLFHQLHSKKFLNEINKLKKKNDIHNNNISKENPRMHSLYAVDKLKKGYEHNRYLANILFSKPSPTILHLGLKSNNKNPSPYDKTRESVAPFKNRIQQQQQQQANKRPSSATSTMRSGTNKLTSPYSTKAKGNKIELQEWDSSPMTPFPKVTYYGNNPREKDYAAWLLSTSMSTFNVNNPFTSPIPTPEKKNNTLKRDKKIKDNTVIQVENFSSPKPTTQIYQQQPPQTHYATELKINKNIANKKSNNEFKSPLSLKLRPFSANANKETSNKDVLRNRILYGRSSQSNEIALDLDENNSINFISKDENNNISNDDIEFEKNFFSKNKSPDRFYSGIDNDNIKDNYLNSEVFEDEEYINNNDDNNNNSNSNNDIVVDNDDGNVDNNDNIDNNVIEEDSIINILDQLPINDDEVLLSTSQSIRTLEAFILEKLV
jgi:hypothetical protein